MISAVSNSNGLRALFAYQKNQSALNQVMERLSTGKRINSGKDDPAGLIATEHLAAEIAALEAESRSIARADANANITDGHASQLGSMLTELNGLVVASANQAGLSDEEIQANQMQIDSLASSIQRVAGDAMSSLDGFAMPEGGNAELESLLNGVTAAVASVANGGANDLSSGNLEAAQAQVEQAISDAATFRGSVGAYQKHTLETRASSNRVALENLLDAKSQISDADFAIETSNLNRLQIMSAANAKVLKISHQQAETVLALLA